MLLSIESEKMFEKIDFIVQNIVLNIFSTIVLLTVEDPNYITSILPDTISPLFFEVIVYSR